MRRTRHWMFVALCLLSLFAAASRAQSSAAPVTTITLGQSIVPLNGPWKFHTGDNPAWASPNFDDSQWETVDLTPKAGGFDPNMGLSAYVPGWTAKGHPGYWGYAWYRIRVSTNARPGEKLALAGPADVDDAYQVFANGRLLGSFGRFPASRGRPVVFATEPRMFPLPQAAGGKGGSTQVLAFRVWMEPSTLMQDPDVGGMHSAPLLGEARVVAAQYQLAWVALARVYSSVAVESALFLLLAMLAASLVLFDRTDPVYWWLAGVFLLTAAETGNLCLAAWTQLEGAITLNVALDVILRPLMLGGWTMVWWAWFRLRRPAWLPGLIAGLTLLYMLSEALGEDLFPAIPHPVGVAFHFISLGVRLLFLLLLVWIAVAGVRRQGSEGWLALPAMLLVGIAQFELELALLHIRTTWFPFGAAVTLAQIAQLVLVVAIAVLLLRRALLSVRRQRQEALDAMAIRFDDRLAERTRIAREFHDTLLQTIQGSKLVADAALKQSSDPVRMYAAIQQLSVWLGEATEEGRAALNSLRSSTTQTNDLAEAFRRFIDECEIQSVTQASFSLTGQVSEMHPIVRDEIYRIGCEAIRNACAHSQASRVQVELSYGEDLTLCVRDNGIGIDPVTINRGKEGHFGLQGMRERAGRITSTLTIDTSEAGGTEVKLVVPGSIIYRQLLPAAGSQKR